MAAIATANEHGELPSGDFGILLEFFRGSVHESILSAMAATLAEEEDDGAALAEFFSDTIDRLRATARDREIKQLTERAKQGLNAAERKRLTELFAAKSAPVTGAEG